jgi:hypothetical protein
VWNQEVQLLVEDQTSRCVFNCVTFSVIHCLSSQGGSYCIPLFVSDLAYDSGLCSS